MLTKIDKENILAAFKLVDVKQMDIEHINPAVVKWFRFGNYNAMQIASEIIKQMPEKKEKVRVS
jgi:hypothetical protein